MAQKRRKNSIITSFLIPLPLLADVDQAVRDQNKRSLKAPLNRSEWIIRAIRRDLDHTRRSRKPQPPSVLTAPPLLTMEEQDLL